MPRNYIEALLGNVTSNYKFAQLQYVELLIGTNCIAKAMPKNQFRIVSCPLLYEVGYAFRA